MPPEGLEPVERLLVNNGTEIRVTRDVETTIDATHINWTPLRAVDPHDERITELEHQVEALVQMVEHLRIQAKEAGVAVEPMTLSEMLTNSD